MFTILMIFVTVLLFFTKYILPLEAVVFGIMLIRKKKMNLGCAIIVLGVLVESVSIITQLNSF